MPGIKETRDALRLSSVLVAKFVAADEDGQVTGTERGKILLSSLGQIWEAVNGISQIGSELLDLDDNETEILISEIINVMRQTRRFTFRERDRAEMVLRLTKNFVQGIIEIRNLPPTAELVTP